MTTAAAASSPALVAHPARPALLLAALGVAYGGIGTSPIYAFRESLRAAGGGPAEPTVFGVASVPSELVSAEGHCYSCQPVGRQLMRIGAGHATSDSPLMFTHQEPAR